MVLDQIMGAKDSSIPMNILQQATCVGVVPGMIKGAFVFGGQYGQGVVTCRTGHGWSAPVFIRMAGGSFGFQIGGQSTDLVLVAVNDRGFQDLLKNKFKIGGDASAAAGPVGRSGQAATDWKMNAELLSYSRNKGMFAGIDLDGTSVSQNNEDTDVYYGAPHHFEAVLKGDVPVPAGRCAVCPHRGALLCCRQEPQVASGKFGFRQQGAVRPRAGPPLSFVRPAQPLRAERLNWCLPSTMRETIEYWLVVAVARTLGRMPRSAGASVGLGSCLHGLLALRPSAPGWRPQPADGSPRTLARSKGKDSARRLPPSRLATGRVLPHDPLHPRKHPRLDAHRRPGALPRRAGRGKGVLVITGHLGAWELSSFYHSLMGHPMGMVIRRLDNRRLDAFVNGIRCLHGNYVLHKDDFGRGLLTAMHKGGTVGILMDTNMTPPQGAFVKFFGIEACTATGLAHVARKTGAAVLPGFMLWEPAERRYVLHFGPEVAIPAHRGRRRRYSRRNPVMHRSHRILDSALS